MLGLKSSLNRKGQSAFEFLFLLLFVIFVASLIVVLLQQNLQQEINVLDRQTVTEFRNVWYEEIQEASTTTQAYDRTFRVEDQPRGFDVGSSFGAAETNRTDELIISFKDLSQLFFLPASIDYTHTGREVSLSDEVRLSRRCYENCQTFIFEGDDVAAGLQGSEVSSVATGESPLSHLEGSWPYVVAGGGGGYAIANISNTSSLSIVVSGNAGTNDVSMYEELAFLAQDGVSVINLSDSPITAQGFAGTSESARFIPDYPYGYNVQERGVLASYYIGNLSNMVSLGSSSVSGLGLVDAAYDPRGYVFAADGNDVHVYDVRDRANPRYIAEYSVGGAQSLTYRDGTLYVVTSGSVESYRPDDPLSGLGSVSDSLSFGGGESQIWRNTLFVEQSEGYRVVDITNSGSLQEIQDVTLSSSDGVYVNHDAAYTVSGADITAWD